MASQRFIEWAGLVDRMLFLAVTQAKNPVQSDEADALMLEWGNLHDEIDEVDCISEAQRVFALCQDFERRLIDLGQRIDAS